MNQYRTFVGSPPLLALNPWSLTMSKKQRVPCCLNHSNYHKALLTMLVTAHPASNLEATTWSLPHYDPPISIDTRGSFSYGRLCQDAQLTEHSHWRGFSKGLALPSSVLGFLKESKFRGLFFLLNSLHQEILSAPKTRTLNPELSNIRKFIQIENAFPHIFPRNWPRYISKVL